MALQYPARYLFTFLENHGMLSVAGSPTWRTVVGGSRTYVDRVVKDLSAVATSTPVRAVIAQTDGVEVRTDDDQGVLFRPRRRGGTCRQCTGPSGQSGPSPAFRTRCIPLLAQRHLAAHRRHASAGSPEGAGILEFSLALVRRRQPARPSCPTT